MNEGYALTRETKTTNKGQQKDYNAHNKAIVKLIVS